MTARSQGGRTVPARPAIVHVHERAIRMAGRRVGSHTIHGATSAYTSSRYRSFAQVMAIEGIDSSRHPGAWPRGRGQCDEKDVVLPDDRDSDDDRDDVESELVRNLFATMDSHGLDAKDVTVIHGVAYLTLSGVRKVTEERVDEPR